MTRNDLIHKLQQCLRDGASHPRPVVAGWIVGATMADEEGRELYDVYDDIRDVAELAAEVETMEDDGKLVDQLWHELTQKTSRLR